jgi:hypothetical protein
MQRFAGITLPILAAVLLSTLTVIALLWLPSNIWQSWQPATCLGTGCFCEAVNTQSPIRQTANTVSSLGFVFGGVFIIAFSYRQSRLGRLPAAYSSLIGLASIVIGLGSAFYHASLTFIGQFLDVFGMFLMATFALVYAWERIYELRSNITLALYLLLNGGLTWLQIGWPLMLRFTFGIVLAIALIFEYFFRAKVKPRITVRWLGIAAGLMLGAYIIWILDNFHIVCAENSILQGHAVWHLLGAVSVLCLHRYYVSESN